ncbi:MAG: hypothetical protein JWQ28_2917 [Pedobacter sp.]|jgi:hypothetical protein|nr:hypothetical protein [Pedobacter sp.]
MLLKSPAFVKQDFFMERKVRLQFKSVYVNFRLAIFY